MNEFMCDWGDSSLCFDSMNNGIPIPRSQGSNIFLRPVYCDQYICDSIGSSPSRTLMVPPNSLNQDIHSHMSTIMEIPRASSLSPYSGDSPVSIIPSSHFDQDIEIKMEPLDEIIDIGISNAQQQKQAEDNLLDNVNFEDLLMTDEMDSSTTCLDPQHSSPAAMATVHPDEVLGMMRSNTFPPHISPFTPSSSVPVKTENISFACPATSFPPQGIGWKDPSHSTTGFNSQHFQSPTNDVHSFNINNTLKPESLYSSSQGRAIAVSPDLSPHEMNQRGDYTSGQSEIRYTQLEPVVNSSSSALHDLLVNSPSTSQSANAQNQFSSHNNLLPLSPMRDSPVLDVPVGQSVPGMHSFLSATSPNLASRLSSSAPVNNFVFDQIWQRREPRQHLLSTGSLAEEIGGSTSSLSTGGGIVSPISYDFSIDEGNDSESDVEHFDSDSDNESLLGEEMMNVGSQGGKKERHFWQYNVQAKGPKGNKVNITQDESNPYNLAKITDPVFSPLCSVQGIKHSGKARRGDGNDLTPSPRKLVTIGVELNKLNKRINDMTPVSELPSTVRSKSRKEKNKLASRACRLKKKAQHEANKIKLFGLEQEHQAMIKLILDARSDLINKLDILRGTNGDPIAREEDSDQTQLQQMFTSHIEKSAKMRTKQRIAGFTTEFVNKVIENCTAGDPTGGLSELSESFVKTSSSSIAGDAGALNYNNQLYT